MMGKVVRVKVEWTGKRFMVVVIGFGFVERMGFG